MDFCDAVDRERSGIDRLWSDLFNDGIDRCEEWNALFKLGIVGGFCIRLIFRCDNGLGRFLEYFQD
jgi:hypothetical protein